MDKNEINALLTLLDDPDEKVYQAIKEKIFQDKYKFKTILENFLTNESVSKTTNTRIESIINEIHLSDTIEKINDWKTNESHNILKAALIIENYFTPLDDIEDLEMKVDNLITEIWLEFNNQLTGLEKIKLINHILFTSEKYQYASNKNISPKTASFHSLINDKIFIDKTISIFYTYLAQRLEVPVGILNVEPGGYSLLGYIDKELESAVFGKNENSIVFYILPTFKGEIWSKKQLLDLSEKENINIDLTKVHALSNKDILRNWVEYKANIYKNANRKSFIIDNANQIISVL